MDEILYKYRSCQNIDRIVDILIRKRLYAPSYTELNDVFEGYFKAQIPVKEYSSEFWTKFKQMHVCSLSKDPKNPLLWAHYADGCKGCCIGLTVPSNKLWVKKTIDYSSEHPELDLSLSVEENFERILSTKSKIWNYEDEVRFLKNVSSNQSCFLPIRVKEIYFGERMKSEYKTLLIRIINLLNKGQNVANQIQIRSMSKTELLN